mmetsp:Transcript_5996/g.17966  ORF Transcript_5996/g.17966 Transcript_5996/m.17966 type:complete len:603 (-) Transcript_5996:54-1862(-)
MDFQVVLPPAAAIHQLKVSQIVGTHGKGYMDRATGAAAPAAPPPVDADDAIPDESGDLGGTPIDHSGVKRMVARLKKTLERPDQAELELDPEGFLRLSALGGKFRLSKMAATLGLNPPPDTPPDVFAKFRRVVNRASPGVFDWRPSDDHADMAVRLMAAAAGGGRQTSREAEALPQYMFPSATPHSLRGLTEKGPIRLRELLEGHGLKGGIPLFFVEPRGVAEYRGAPNEPVLEMLHALHDAVDCQLVVLTWVGAEGVGPRLTTFQQRADFMLGRFGLHGVPAIAASGTRAGLPAMAQLVAEALGTTATVLTRGKDALEACFSSRYLKAVAEHAGGAPGGEPAAHPLVTVWSYASQASRSTSSTGSGGPPARRGGGGPPAGGDSPEAAAELTAALWIAVAGRLSATSAATLHSRSAVLVDTAEIARKLAANGGDERPPVVAVEDLVRRGGVPQQPPSPAVFDSLFCADAAAMAAAATSAAVKTRLPAAGLLVCACMAEEHEDVAAWLDENGDVLAELAPSTVEQARVVGMVAHAFDSGWAAAGCRVLAVFKALHDADVVEDEGFQRWAKAAPAGRTRAQAAPFLKWLEEAEEDEEDETGGSE